MHYVADVEREDPVVGAVVFHTESATGRDLELLLDLHLVDLDLGWKRWTD